MVGPPRPQFVLFGSSIIQFSFSNDGWGAMLADIYARKVFLPPFDLIVALDMQLLELKNILAVLPSNIRLSSDLQADIFVRGYACWNSRRALEVLDKVFPKNAPTQPALAIVYLGGNDSMGPHPSGLGPHVPLPEYVDNMRKVATHLKVLFYWPL
ncbi:hypothetical protein Cgig2_032730 [Carnegiea gigantea]|uniref:SGNH hydrolase-type esterase domain-containing protein n=1 Tax=Carnegiea gigantea TaxID=171969 RepID=A0A9Q1KGK6_9CARY|nr:hypothetical protein Cgig2_032730 [Carnegiea gigantea]